MKTWQTDLKHFLIRSGQSFFGANAIASSLKWHAEHGFSVLYVVKESGRNEKLNMLFRGTREKINHISNLSDVNWSPGAINMLTVPDNGSDHLILPVVQAITEVKNCFFGFDEVPVPDLLLNSDEIGNIAYQRSNRIGIKYPFDPIPKIGHQVIFEVISPLK